jgi:glycosyltransferase involved in cell wall biosynthesis
VKATRKWRIAVWHNLPSGGGKRALFHHVKGLVERGHHVESWCPPTADQTYLPLSELCREHVVPLSTKPALPWLQRGRALLERADMARRLSAMDDHCRQCAAEINSGGFDVLFGNACVFFRTTPIAKHVRIPSVIYLGEPYRWLYEALPRLPWAALPKSAQRFWSFKGWHRFVSDLLHVQSLRLQLRDEVENAAAFKTILVNSLFSRESVLRAYGLESKVCFLGVDLDHFRPTGEPVDSFVLGLGGIDYPKGADRAIRALACVDVSKRPELIWIGNFSNSECEKEVKSLARQLGVRFTVKVRVSDKELLSFLSRALMLLYVSRLEPFGLAPLEANACGTPVVAIAEGGVRESVVHEQNGLLVDSGDPGDLADAIERLIDDPKFATDLRRRSIRHVNNRWSMEAAIDRIEAALCKAIGDPTVAEFSFQRDGRVSEIANTRKASIRS